MTSKQKTRNVWNTLGEHPGYVVMRSIARFDGMRGAIAALQRVTRRPLAGFLQTLESQRSRFFDSTDTVRMKADLERDGMAFGLRLPDSTVRELTDFARTHRCFVDRNPTLGFMPADIVQARHKLGREFLLAQYFNLRAESPLIDELARDPVLLSIAARYLGTEPTLVGVNLFWSYPAAVPSDQRSYAAQMFHYDLDDFKFLKFFFYLTDVDEISGPHVAVKNTHRVKRFASFRERLKVRRYSDAEISASYGGERIVTITGPAGTGFAEDTICIHKGLPPTGRERLILQFQYALNDWGVQRDEKDASELAMI
jgi:hypothetical protein